MRLASIFLIFIIALVLRAPDLFPARFWAEDLAVFMSGQLNAGAVSVIKPYAGYLHLVPRLTAVVAAALPLQFAPIVFTVVVITFSAWSATIAARAVGGWIGGLVAAVSFVLVSGWDEPVGSVTNLQWLMAPALLVLVLSNDRLPTPEGIIFALFASLSGPFAAVFGPVITAVVIIRYVKTQKIDWVSLTATVGGLVQICVIILNPSPSSNELPEPLWLMARLLRLPFSFSPFPLISAALLIVTIVLGHRRWVLVGLLAGITLMTAVVAFKFHHQPRIFESGIVGHRYWYVQGVLWVLIGAYALSDRGWLTKVFGTTGLILMLWNAINQPLAREWQWPTEDWQAFIVHAHNGPAVFKYAPDWEFNLDLRTYR